MDWKFWRTQPKIERQEPVIEQAPAVTVKKKPKKPRVAKPKNNDPKVDIVKFDFDPLNPRIGSIELDWNNEFVELLKTHGYAGESDEDIVDRWLNDVCRNIVANDYQGSSVPPNALVGAQIVNKKDIGGGKTEVS